MSYRFVKCEPSQHTCITTFMSTIHHTTSEPNDRGYMIPMSSAALLDLSLDRLEQKFIVLSFILHPEFFFFFKEFLDLSHLKILKVL